LRDLIWKAVENQLRTCPEIQGSAFYTQCCFGTEAFFGFLPLQASGTCGNGCFFWMALRLDFPYEHRAAELEKWIEKDERIGVEIDAKGYTHIHSPARGAAIDFGQVTENNKV
jgi:hypothetical protein